MELVLGARHEVASYREEYQLVYEWFLQIDLNVLVGEYALAFDQQGADLGLPDDVPPVLTVLYHILDHLIIVALELVVLLIAEQP